jgi:myo-inositol 2-dehydrogenase/D-chiro-inositol 1-dehydrogenase
VEAVLKDKEVPVKLETGITVMKIGQGLQHALLTGEVVRFNG